MMLDMKQLDPRPDLAADHDEWERLLDLAGQLQDKKAHSYLLLVRANGARLERSRLGLRLQSGEWDESEWAALQRMTLVQVMMVVGDLLRTDTRVPETVLDVEDAPLLDDVRSLAAQKGWPLLPNYFAFGKVQAWTRAEPSVLWEHFLEGASANDLRQARELLKQLPDVGEE